MGPREPDVMTGGALRMKRRSRACVEWPAVMASLVEAFAQIEKKKMKYIVAKVK